MAATSQIDTDVLSKPKPPSGTVVNAMRLAVESDEEALERAKAMVDGHAVELWDGLRFIEHFPPVD
jgi:hypothetical protein